MTGRRAQPLSTRPIPDGDLFDIPILDAIPLVSRPDPVSMTGSGLDEPGHSDEVECGWALKPGCEHRFSAHSFRIGMEKPHWWGRVPTPG